MAAQFLRSVQLRLGVYFQSIDTMSAAEARLVPPPNLVGLLVSIRVQSWVPPIMPRVPTLPSVPVAPPAAAPAPAAGPQPRPRLLVPAVPGGAPAPAPAVPDPSREQVTTNPAVIPEIKAAMEGRHFQIRELFSDTGRPPTTSAGHPICCSYHLRGYCFANCHRSNTRLPLSAPDAAKLCQFVQTHVVSPNVGRSAAA